MKVVRLDIMTHLMGRGEMGDKRNGPDYLSTYSTGGLDDRYLG